MYPLCPTSGSGFQYYRSFYWPHHSHILSHSFCYQVVFRHAVVCLIFPHPHRTSARPQGLLLVLVHSGPKYFSPSLPVSSAWTWKKKLHLSICQQWLPAMAAAAIQVPCCLRGVHFRLPQRVSHPCLCPFPRAWLGCSLPTVGLPKGSCSRNAASLRAGWDKLKLLPKPPYLVSCSDFQPD